MSNEETMRRYFSALEKSDYHALVALFSDGAVIHSPLYGEKDAREFYAQLTRDTVHCKIGIRQLFTSVTDPNWAAAHFDYEWTLKDGVPRNLELVDLFEFASGTGLIRSLKIVFDTYKTRQAFEAQKK